MSLNNAAGSASFHIQACGAIVEEAAGSTLKYLPLTVLCLETLYFLIGGILISLELLKDTSKVFFLDIVNIERLHLVLEISDVTLQSRHFLINVWSFGFVSLIGNLLILLTADLLPEVILGSLAIPKLSKTTLHVSDRFFVFNGFLVQSANLFFEVGNFILKS